VLFKTGQVSLDGLMNAVEVSVKSGKRSARAGRAGA
jgi:hypothetical protein